MKPRPVHRLIGGLLDALVILGVGAGAGLLLLGRPPSPLFLAVGRLLCAGYLLLRDAFGRSPGKRRMKLRVVSTADGRATFGQHVLRNVTIAAVPISGGIPVAIQIAWALGLVEIALVLLGRDRLGDLLAQTTVVAEGAPVSTPEAEYSGSDETRSPGHTAS